MWHCSPGNMQRSLSYLFTMPPVFAHSTKIRDDSNIQFTSCLQDHIKKTVVRGESKKIYGDSKNGGTPFSCSVGVQMLRTSGVVESSPCFASLSNAHWKVLLQMTRRAEVALKSFADPSILHQLLSLSGLSLFQMSMMKWNILVQWHLVKIVFYAATPTMISQWV